MDVSDVRSFPTLALIIALQLIANVMHQGLLRHHTFSKSTLHLMLGNDL